MQAGKNLAAALAVAVAGVAMAAAVSDRIADAAPYASWQAQSAAAPAATEVGGAPATPADAPVPFSLTLHGEIAGLAAGATATATVFVGGRSYPATVQGDAYSATVEALNGDEIVVVEVASTRARYRSFVGSAARLAAAAGGDADVSLSERASLRVSPFSSALAFLVRTALGGRDAASDAEFENATRSVVGYNLANNAFMLDGWTRGTFALPQGYQDGQQILEAPAAVYNQQVGQINVAPAMAYLYDNADNAPLTELAQLPETLAMLGPIPVNEDSVAVSDLQLLYRQSDGASYALFEEEPLAEHPRYNAALTAQGEVALAPIGNAGARNALRALPFAPTVQSPIQRSVRGHTLRRVAVGDVYSLWMSRTVWFDSHHSAAGDWEQEYPSYSLWSAFDLNAVSAANNWAPLLDGTIEAALYFLPAPCSSPRRAAAYLPAFGKCEHRAYWFIRPHGGLVYNPATYNDYMQSVQGSGSADFSHEIVGGRLRIMPTPAAGEPYVSTTFWRYEEGEPLRRPVLYLSSSSGGYMVGASMALAPQPGFAPGEMMGSWRGPTSQGRFAQYPAPYSTFEIRRLANGYQRDVSIYFTGSETFTQGEWWSGSLGVADYQYLMRYPGATTTRPASHCREAFFGGASECAPSRVRHFRPLQRVGSRLYGLVDFYSNTALKPQGYTGTYDTRYMDSRADYIECVAGACLPPTP
ncbi:hypothetical protein J5226_09935 [Lysobacter sp. K5869]|uniref:hypothetical protein n=1 Tax=Lysobacter sp. K5869 TaxID=2820808 RepID=UPI001C060B6D|nr:hypothetical protein [Lysobacter sp. K5869]QWP78683.1 hypothetical protein J5226_09935 [Lysobacter sp. K5869]